MPRPSKRVSPDTLGGRIRTARQDLHLALAEVVGDRYSTSLNAIVWILHRKVYGSCQSVCNCHSPT
jgi:hypothetical protein